MKGLQSWLKGCASPSSTSKDAAYPQKSTSVLDSIQPIFSERL